MAAGRRVEDFDRALRVDESPDAMPVAVVEVAMTVVGRDTARERAVGAITALAGVNGLGELMIVDEGIVETENAWYFPYDSVAYVEEGDIVAALAGNLQVMVPKDGGEITFMGPE